MQKQFEKPSPRCSRRGISQSFFAFAISQKRTAAENQEPGFKEESKRRRDEFASSFKMLLGAGLLTSLLLGFFGPQNPLSFRALWPAKPDSTREPLLAKTQKTYTQPKVSPSEKKDEDVFLRHSRAEVESDEPAPTAIVASESDETSRREPAVEREKLTIEIDRAKDLVDSGKHEEAKEILERVLEKDPENHEALAELGMLHLIDLGDRQGAFDYLKRALSSDPSNMAVVEKYSSLCTSLGRNDQCLELLSSLEKSSPQNAAGIAQGKAQILIHEKRYAEAIPSLEVAASVASDSQAYSDLAIAYREGGQSSKAIEALELAIERERELKGNGFYESDPERGEENYVLRHLELASELEAQGRSEAAMATLDKLKGVVQSESKLASIIANFEKYRN